MLHPRISLTLGWDFKLIWTTITSRVSEGSGSSNSLPSNQSLFDFAFRVVDDKSYQQIDGLPVGTPDPDSK